jgi:hypothetical protein
MIENENRGMFAVGRSQFAEQPFNQQNTRLADVPPSLIRLQL